jgi:hypothetical protein
MRQSPRRPWAWKSADAPVTLSDEPAGSADVLAVGGVARSHVDGRRAGLSGSDAHRAERELDQGADR